MLKTFAVTASLLLGTSTLAQIAPPPILANLSTEKWVELRPKGSHYSNLVVYSVYNPIKKKRLNCFAPLDYMLRIKADSTSTSGFIMEAYQDGRLVPLRWQAMTGGNPANEAKAVYYYPSGQFGPTLLITP